METYIGHVRTPADAIVLFEACRIGLLPRVQRRLSEKERQSIKPGSVFVWDEREAGMRRWTDGKSWSASRVSGSFLTYREMEGKRGGNGDKTSREGSNNDGDSDGGPDGYRYKPDGLIKQSFSITTNGSQHLHLISYYSRSMTAMQSLLQPTTDSQLRHIRPEKGLYPESTVHEQSTMVAATRVGMHSPSASAAALASAPTLVTPVDAFPYPPGQAQAPYQRNHPGHVWAPPSPMHTPPQHHPFSLHYPQPAAAHHQNGTSPYPAQYPPPYQHAHAQAPYDCPPPAQPHDGLHHHHRHDQYPPPPPGHLHNHPAHNHSYHPPPPSAAHPHGPPPQHSPYSLSNCHFSEGLPAIQYPQSTPGYNSHYSDHLVRKDDHHLRRPSVNYEYSASSQRLPPPPLTNGHHRRPSWASSAGDSQPSSNPQTHTPISTAPAPASSIPSISSMLNSMPQPEPDRRNPLANNALPVLHQPPPHRPEMPALPRSTSLSPTVRRPLQDIPIHKLGFEASRDVQALRNLDKSTLKF